MHSDREKRLRTDNETRGEIMAALRGVEDRLAARGDIQSDADARVVSTAISAIAALASPALTAEPQAVPEGMVLVPKEPASFAWVDELYQAVEAIGKRPTDFTMRELLLWYRAMLAASPAVQGGDHGE